MKSTGVVRRVDELGRVVLPKELRDTLGIEIKTPLEIFTEGDLILLREYSPGCCLCGDPEKPLVTFKGKNICTDCKEDLKKG